MHHSGAGWGTLSGHDVVARIERAGHAVRVLDTKLGWDDLSASDVVIAAGGDGTILGVVRRLALRPVPLVVLPTGTANNVARTLGLTDDLDALLETLASPRERGLDVGLAAGSWGERFFTESVGIGWFCDALALELDKHDKPIERALRRLSELLARYEPRAWKITIDGSDASGAYTFVDVMNARMVGPNLCFAPHADPFDGWLDVVLATDVDQPRAQAYVEALRRDPLTPPPSFEVRRAKHVRFELRNEERIRVDGTVCPKKDTPPSYFADVRLLPGAVPLWLPPSP